MASKKKKPEHPCIARIDAALAERGHRLANAIYLNGTPRDIFVRTESLAVTGSGRVKKDGIMLAAVYCPFCGEKVNP